MVGEFVLQVGKLVEVVCWYLQVVQQIDGDVGLVECVICIFMFVNDDVSVVKGLVLWQQCVLCLLIMCSVVGVLVMCQGDVKVVCIELQVLLVDFDECGWKFVLVVLIGGGCDLVVFVQVFGELVDVNVILLKIEVWQEFGCFVLCMDKFDLVWCMIDEVVKCFFEELCVVLLCVSQLQQVGEIDKVLLLLYDVELKIWQDFELCNVVVIVYDSLG